jgi:hypothetical protein
MIKYLMKNLVYLIERVMLSLLSIKRRAVFQSALTKVNNRHKKTFRKLAE